MCVCARVSVCVRERERVLQILTMWLIFGSELISLCIKLPIRGSIESIKSGLFALPTKEDHFSDILTIFRLTILILVDSNEAKKLMKNMIKSIKHICYFQNDFQSESILKTSDLT